MVRNVDPEAHSAVAGSVDPEARSVDTEAGQGSGWECEH